MIIGLTQEQRERLEAATKVYQDEIAAITKEVIKDCKTDDDLEMALAVLQVAMDQACKKAKSN